PGRTPVRARPQRLAARGPRRRRGRGHPARGRRRPGHRRRDRADHRREGPGRGAAVRPARMTEMTHETVIARPADAVLDFAADARTWPRWHPTTVSTTVDGDRIAEVVRAGPLRGTIAWRVVRRGERSVTLHGTVDFPLMRETQVTVTYVVTPEGNGS